MPLFLLMKSDNSIDNQLKVSFQRKKLMKPPGKSLPPKQTGRLCLYLQMFFFLPKPEGAGHESAPRQVVCIRCGLSVEDLPAMHRGRPLPGPRRQEDCTQTCHQHLRGEYTPTKAAPDQNQAAQAAPASTQGAAAAVLAERFLLSSTHSFLHCLPTTESRERGWTLSPLAFPHTSAAKRGMCWARTAGGGGRGPWSRPLVYQIDLCSIHLTRSKCSMNFGHYTKLAISWVSAETLFLLSLVYFRNTEMISTVS